jgi:hypothetical protein
MGKQGGGDFNMRNNVNRCMVLFLYGQSLVKQHLLFSSVKKYCNPSCKEAQ